MNVVFVLGCGSKSAPAPGTERGPCDNGTCHAGLARLSQVCVTPPVSSVDAAQPAVVDAAARHDAVGGPTVVYAIGEDGAIILACSSRVKELVGDGSRCGQLDNDLVATTVGGSPPKQIALGRQIGHYCHAGLEDRGPPRPALAMATRADDAIQFVVTPASRVSEIRLEDATPVGDLAALTTRIATLLNGSKTFDGPFHVEKIELRSVIHADIDGDRKLDTIYSVAAPSDQTFAYKSVILAELTTTPRALTTLLVEQEEQVQATASLDVDQDGRDELFVVGGGHDFGEIFVARFDGKQLQRVGSWACGL